MLDIVLSVYRPAEVSASVDRLLDGQSKSEVYDAVISALIAMDKQDRKKKTSRSVNAVAFAVEFVSDLKVDEDEVERASRELAGASRGLLGVTSNGTLIINGDIQELVRRVAHLTGRAGPPRKLGGFRRPESDGADSVD